MKVYNPKKIEAKWQKEWAKSGVYRQYSRKKKFYVLDMFPYPSGAGLHVGHPKGYIATDVLARMKQLQGYGVLHPMGWDAFGLPAEQFALKNKVHPEKSVRENIATFKKQLEKIGFTYDWDREINTTDPEYYKWTQWIFLQMWKKGLAYESYDPIIWCPSCKTGLANEDLEQGRCERCGGVVEKRPLRQWVLRMTKYADRLLRDLDTEKLEWSESIKEQQRNWIGRSVGAEAVFYVADTEEEIRVYTTRLDTIFGCTYLVVAPEHPMLKNLESRISNLGEVKKYIKKTVSKSDLERTELSKEKSGIELQGLEAIHPFTGKRLPVYVADYVLGGYGTGAVMGVPAHDTRDFEFAKKYELDIDTVIIPVDEKNQEREEAFVDDGILIDSKEFTGLGSAEAREKMAAWLAKEKLGKKKVNYKMRDWTFSRQRYWGEPIPIIYCRSCWKIKNQKSKIKITIQNSKNEEPLRETTIDGVKYAVIPVPEKDLPVKLPKVKSYEPTDTGESPLASIASWVNVKCPKCQGPAKRETNTMPQWAGSSWYYLRFIDPKNKKALVDKKKEKKMMPVDVYVGGTEHATRHLLYARFWHKFLYDIKVVSGKEPFKKLVNQGLIVATDGRKMSKRWNNVINPDDMVAQFGADAFRVYEMFMGPFTQSIAWNTDGVVGSRRFLEKVWKLQGKITTKKYTPRDVETLIHQTIQKVTEDIENFKFNTAISALMILVNALEKEKEIFIHSYGFLLLLLSPFAPHMTEELWHAVYPRAKSVNLEKWPTPNEEFLEALAVKIAVQINGKLRAVLDMPAKCNLETVKKAAFSDGNIQKHLEGKTVRKEIYIQDKILNLVV